MKAKIGSILVIWALGAVMIGSTPDAKQREVVPPGPGVIAAPGQNLALAYRRWVAITHTGDYLQQSHLLRPYEYSLWRTLTSLFGINGSDRVADIGVYVFGDTELFLSVFHHLDPGREHRLLPGDRYFGPGALFDQHFDGQPPDYKGETIVVVSSEPVIVTGAVTRGFHTHNLYEQRTNPDLDLEDAESRSMASRTLDVRQFDCSVPADFAKVAHFCRSLSPREQ